MKIYKLEVFSQESSFLLGLKKQTTQMQYPRELFCSNNYHSFTTYFSSQENALSHYQEVFGELEQEDKDNIIYFTIETHELNSNDFIETQQYSSQAKLLRTFSNEEIPFLGDDKPLYQLGDWVLYFENGCLMVGKIGYLPYSSQEVANKKLTLTDDDNMYYIFYADSSNPKDEFPHSHLHPSNIIRLIKEEDVLTYLTPAEKDHIEVRYKQP